MFVEKKKKKTNAGWYDHATRHVTTGAWLTLPAQRQKNSQLIVKSTKIPQTPIIMYIRGTKVHKKLRQSDHWWCTLYTTQSKQKMEWECSLGPTSTLRPTTLCPLQTLHHVQTAESWVRGTIWMGIEVARDCHVHWYCLAGGPGLAGVTSRTLPLPAIYLQFSGMMMCPPRHMPTRNFCPRLNFRFSAVSILISLDFIVPSLSF